MKVVLFCGGLGLRIRDFTEAVPKPLVPIGSRPILWHVMKYYAYYGHKDFILCLGHRGEAIKEFFLNYNECLSNDFTLLNGGQKVELFHSDIHDWKITFVDTGIESNIGQRLAFVKEHLKNEDVFLANYADGLTDLPLTSLIDFARKGQKIATFLSARPNLSFHMAEADSDGTVTRITEMMHSNIRINSGYFVLRQQIFDFLQNGEELLREPFQRLIRAKQLSAFTYDGFFHAMDTFKDRQILEELYSRDTAPWAVWRVRGKTNA